jgi:anaerobic magnesium-protoporphyrin IX monomethyl ester cyclase
MAGPGAEHGGPFHPSARTLLVFPRAFEPNTVPPLGIAQLAACLRQAGHEVDLLDLTVEPLRPVDYSRYCLVGMTLLCTNFSSGTGLARRIRGSNGSICIAAGGPFADACAKDVLDTGAFDVVAHGEGEWLLPELVAALKSGGDLGSIAGLSFRRREDVVRTGSAPMTEDLDALPFPAYDLLPIRRYPRHSIMASRGCPYGCIFCDRGPSESKRVRYVSAERVVDWAARMVRDFGDKPLRILDSTFTVNQRWAERVCDRIIESGLGLSWHCQSRIDCFNPGLLEKMLEAGCTHVVAGVESGNNDILGLSKKSLTTQEARAGARLFQEGKAPQLHVNFIIGHPWDTRESIDETLELADELERDCGARVGFYMMVPFPGTELWENPRKYEIEIRKDWRQYAKLSFAGHPELLSATFDSKYLRAEELTLIYHEIFARRRRKSTLAGARSGDGARPGLRSRVP